MTVREERYQDALNEGHSAAWEQKWDQAAEYYKQALNEKPGDSKALNSLALALFEMREYTDALQCYLLVAEKTPHDPATFEKIAILYDALNKPKMGSKVAVRAAEIYLKLGDVEKAIENWARATEMDIQNINAHSRLAVVFEHVDRIPQAVRTYLQIASILQHSGQVDKAVQVINRALKISPDDNEASRALETLREGKKLLYHHQSKKMDTPITGLKPVLLKEPKKEPIHEYTPIQEAEQKALTELAKLFFEQTSEEEERQKARTADFKKIVDGTGPLIPKDVDQNNIRLYLGQVVEDLSRGDKYQAAENLKRLVEIGMNHPAAFYHLGVIRYENNRLESAIRYLRHSVNHKDYALASRLVISQALRKQGQVNEAALENLEALKIADSEFVPATQVDIIRQLYDPLIEAHAQKPNEEDSGKLCEAINEILHQPSWRQNLRKIRDELSTEKDYPIPIAEVLTTVRSSQVVVAMSTIRQLAREGRRHAAFEEALFALQDAPTYLPLHITIGDILIASNQIESAIEKFKVVARSYSVRGESARTVDMLKRVVQLSPLDMVARQSLIDQLVFRGQHEETIDEYIKMAEVYYNLANLADSRKTYTKGLRFVEQASLDERWRVKILHKIADIDVQSLNWRQGLAIYDKICTIIPNDFAANRNRIDLNFRLGESKQALIAIGSFVEVLLKENRSGEVLDFLEELTNDRPQEVIIKTLLAEQYERLGRTQDAIQRYDEAREIFENKGNIEGAVVVLKKIIALNPENAEEYQQLLENLQ